jgi:sulfate transport system substrate-binding protein
MVVLGGVAIAAAAEPRTLLNVSYDVSREFYKELNPAFIARWTADSGETLTINQSHAGSSKQVRSVIDGLTADVAIGLVQACLDLLAPVARGVVELRSSRWTRLLEGLPA